MSTPGPRGPGQPPPTTMPPVASCASPEQSASDEAQLLAALRDGDEAAFVLLVERYHTGMLRLARMYVPDAAMAEEVAQEAWLSILRHLAGLQARVSLRTWIFRSVLNAARARAAREHRAMPFSAMGAAWAEAAEPAVEPQRFRGPDDQWPGGWVSFPPSWGEAPEQHLRAGEVRQFLGQAVDQLPPAEREVVILRDVHGWSAEDVCQILEVSDATQRVLLHRGRSKLRRGLAHYLAGE